MSSRHISRRRFFEVNLSALNVMEKPCQTADFSMGRKVERWMVCSDGMLPFLIKLIYFVVVKIPNDLFSRRFIARLKGNLNE